MPYLAQKNRTMKISELTPTERPREKLLTHGPATLSTAELLAILLRTGTPQENVLDLSHRLLAETDGRLLKLYNLPLDALCAIRGIKRDKAATLMAAFELGRRVVDEEYALPQEPLNTPAAVYKLMLPQRKGKTYEECWILMVNKAQRLIEKRLMTRGGSNATVIDIKDILKAALDCKAQGLILVHNHPSGDPRPGAGDIAETNALQKAAHSMELTLLDHVIVCDDAYYSFTDDRMIRAL